MGQGAEIFCAGFPRGSKQEAAHHLFTWSKYFWR